MKKIMTGLLLAVLLCFSGLPFLADNAGAAGATLYVSPASGNYSVGDSFTIKVMVNSGGGSGINASEGSLKFDPTILKATSVSKGTIFSLWTEEPSFSNGSGKVSFGGGSPSAYKGTAGSIISVSFTVLKQGDADISFSSGLVLANDGQGTNILSNYGSGKYTIKEAVAKNEPTNNTPNTNTTNTTNNTNSTTGKKDDATKTDTTKEDSKEKGILPPAPEVSSVTHPKEDVWYANNKPEFKWKLLADVIAVSISTTQTASSDPGTDSDGIIENKSFDNVKNGQWYVHVKFKNKYGWSQITHRKFLVDTEAPSPIDIKISDGGDATNPMPGLNFETTDAVSGIDHYKVVMNNEVKDALPSDFTNGTYHWSILPPGENNLVVTAFDKAGNIASSSKKFVVESLKMPIISDIPKTLVIGKEQLVIRGTSFYPEVTVNINIAKPGKDPDILQVKTDTDGNWAFFSDKRLEIGTYEVWANLTDSRGASSYNTSKNVLTVVSPSILQSFGWMIIALLTIIAIGELLVIFYLLKKFSEERLRIKRETQETKNVVAKVFTALKEELDEQMEFADKKKGLSESERRVKERLQEALDVAQEFINKEIDDAEKEIKIKKKDKR